MLREREENIYLLSSPRRYRRVKPRLCTPQLFLRSKYKTANNDNNNNNDVTVVIKSFSHFKRHIKPPFRYQNRSHRPR